MKAYSIYKNGKYQGWEMGADADDALSCFMRYLNDKSGNWLAMPC